jgi:hypothetical protein
MPVVVIAITNMAIHVKMTVAFFMFTPYRIFLSIDNSSLFLGKDIETCPM